MKITIQDILKKKKESTPVVVLTAYDYPSARILDECGVDVILVGDSLGMVLLGFDSTIPVTMEDMLHHTRAVTRAVKRALVVADMPFGSYDSPEAAAANARRLTQEAGADAVKLEGGLKIERQIQAVLDAGIPVMGHTGMMPQSVAETGGYRVQGRDAAQAEAILKDAQALERLGAFAIVLECIPASLAEKISREVCVPTIGIGAGPKTDGQVLVLHDMLGISGAVSPKFVRRYASIEEQIKQAVNGYRRDVLERKFPDRKESFE